MALKAKNAAAMLNALCDSPAVHLFQRQCLQDQQVERSLQQIGLFTQINFKREVWLAGNFEACGIVCWKVSVAK